MHIVDDFFVSTMNKNIAGTCRIQNGCISKSLFYLFVKTSVFFHQIVTFTSEFLIFYLYRLKLTHLILGKKFKKRNLKIVKIKESSLLFLQYQNPGCVHVDFSISPSLKKTALTFYTRPDG